MTLGNFSEDSLNEVAGLLDFGDKSAGDLFFPAVRKKCPPGTDAIGVGYCRNRAANKYGFIPAINKQCPPRTRAVGAGFCRVNYSESLAFDEMKQSIAEKRKKIEELS